MRAARAVTARLVVLVVVLAALVLVTACSSGPKSSKDRKQVESVLRQAGYPAATAKCATDRVFAALTDAELRQLIHQGASPTATVSGQLRQKVMNAIRGCVGSTSSPTSPSTG